MALRGKREATIEGVVASCIWGLSMAAPSLPVGENIWLGKSGCRSCGPTLECAFVDLGMSSLANSYIKPAQLNLTFPIARYGVSLSFREVFGIEFCDTPQLAAGSFIRIEPFNPLHVL